MRVRKNGFDKWEIAVLNAIDGIKEPKKITKAHLNALHNLEYDGIIERLPGSSKHTRFENKIERHIFKLCELMGEGLYSSSMQEIADIHLHITVLERIPVTYRVYVNNHFRFDIRKFNNEHFVTFPEFHKSTLADLWRLLKICYDYEQTSLV